MLLLGVKVAVRVVPVPVRAESVPPEKLTSLMVKEVPGFSEKVNVMVAVSPALRVERTLLIVRVGCSVSMVMVKAELAADSLPALSVALALRVWLPSVRVAVVVMLQLPLASAVAVPSSVVPSVS